MPGQMPVTTAKEKNTAGTYNNQCTTVNPVSAIPIHIKVPENKKKNRMGLFILYFAIAMSPYIRTTDVAATYLRISQAGGKTGKVSGFRLAISLRTV